MAGPSRPALRNWRSARGPGGQVKLSVTSGALEDLEAWSTTNPTVLSRIIGLIAEATRTPRAGTGKPERLKLLGGEVWSRRITEKDRLVYDIQQDAIIIIACRFRYDDHGPNSRQMRAPVVSSFSGRTCWRQGPGCARE
jgi:toxin YoeB